MEMEWNSVLELIHANVMKLQAWQQQTVTNSGENAAFPQMPTTWCK